MNNSIIDGLIAAACGNHAEAIEAMMQRENEATTKAEHAILTRYPSINISADDNMLLVNLEAAYYDLGFSNGFRLAVRLMAECM